MYFSDILHGNKQRSLLILGLFVAVGLVVYTNSLGNPFQYDDQLGITDNWNIRTLKNIPAFFADPKMLTSNQLGPQGGHYRPLVLTSYALNYAVSGLNPWSYHLFNLFFHVGTSFILYLLFQTMWSSDKDAIGRPAVLGGLSAGLIFLLHPFNSEIVNYATARSSVLSGFFYLLGFYCWVLFRNPGGYSSNRGSGRKWSYYILSFLAFIAAMLSKEVAITLPVVLWLYDRYGFASLKGEGHGENGWLNWKTHVVYLPFALIVIVPYLIIRASSFGSAIPPFQRGLLSQISTELPVLVRYLRMFLFPTPLSPFHDIPIYKDPWHPPVLFSAFLLLCLLSLAMYFFRWRSFTPRVISFFVFWFFIVLLPTTIIPLNAIFQENRGYIAIVAFSIFSGVIVCEILQRGMQKVVLIVLALVLVVYASAVVHRNSVWGDEITLWSDTVRKNPASHVAYSALGAAFVKRGMFEEALRASQKALSLGGGSNFYVYSTLGRAYLGMKRYDLAISSLERAIEIYPYAAIVYIDAGNAYLKIGQIAAAERRFKEAIKIDPHFYHPYFYLGSIYAGQQRLEEAIFYYNKAFSLAPPDRHLESQFLIGSILEDLGRKDEAAAYYRRVIRYGGVGERGLADEARDRLRRMGMR